MGNWNPKSFIRCADAGKQREFVSCCPRHWLDALMDGLLTSDVAPTGLTRLTECLNDNADAPGC